MVDSFVMPADAPPSKKRRRLIQFSLRTALILFAMVGLLFAWIRQRLDERDALQAVARSGGRVFFPMLGDPRGGSPEVDKTVSQLWPRKLVAFVGPEFFRSAYMVELRNPAHLNACFQELPKLRRLKSLSIFSAPAVSTTAYQVDHVDNESLRLIGKLSHLRTLGFRGAVATDDALKHLVGCPHLETLGIGGIPMRGDGLRHLKHLPALISLIISDAPVNGAAANAISELAHLRGIDLCRTGADDATATLIARLPQLELVHIDGGPLSDKGMAELAKLKSLKDLSLSDTAITDEGVRQIANLTGLESLTLGCTRITDRGLTELAGLSRLKVLAIPYLDITDEGLHALENIPSLERVALEPSSIPPSQAKAMKLLIHFGTYGTAQISDAAIARLKAVNPKLLVER